MKLSYLSPRILSGCAPELATPICHIINASLEIGIFPSRWKRAKIIPIPKSNPPVSLSDLRPISLTPAPSKILERIIAKELSQQTESKLDTCQFGNTKGSSPTYYLIKLTDKAYAGAEEGKGDAHDCPLRSAGIRCMLLGVGGQLVVL